MSHEIRTPINAVIGIADMLFDTEMDGRQRELLEKLKTNSGVMLSLINDILDFSKIESGKMEVVDEYFRLPALMESIDGTFRLLFEQKDLSFLCTVSENVPSVVFGDEKHIRQILTNILSNSLKYTREGSVEFSTDAVDDGDGIFEVRFSVKDTGIGIKEEDIATLFDEFTRTDLKKNRSISGTGLGLAITKNLAVLMGGDVSVTSEYGVGSEFTVTIPLTAGDDTDMPYEEQGAESFTVDNVRALVADDIEINVEIAAYQLSQYGISVDEAADGQIAFDMVRENDYDIVFLDHLMPNMDGIEAAKAIRTLGGPKSEVPIVALTANAIIDQRNQFDEAGFDAFLSKPVDSGELARTLLRLLPPERIHKTK
jgi:CheY-like chemotaxis protein